MDVEKKKRLKYDSVLPPLPKKSERKKTVSQDLKISSVHFFFYLMIFLMFHDFFKFFF